MKTIRNERLRCIPGNDPNDQNQIFHSFLAFHCRICRDWRTICHWFHRLDPFLWCKNVTDVWTFQSGILHVSPESTVLGYRGNAKAVMKITLIRGEKTLLSFFLFKSRKRHCSWVVAFNFSPVPFLCLAPLTAQQTVLWRYLRADILGLSPYEVYQIKQFLTSRLCAFFQSTSFFCVMNKFLFFFIFYNINGWNFFEFFSAG